MRLLERFGDHDFRLTDDIAEKTLPRYAILSHTWSTNASDEVILPNFADGSARTKPGWAKVRFCGEQAWRDGLRHFWVDTCCIDKTSTAELGVSINSMFRWYSRAERCYVYIDDVPSPLQTSGPGHHHTSWEDAFRHCRWFTRGWTLQELLAPQSVEFFTADGYRLGDKLSLESTIRAATGLPTAALRGDSLSGFKSTDVLRWAARRQTTREEDKAYCLMGILGVSMPVIYGEGEANATRRLREEIATLDPLSPKLYVVPYRDRKDRNPRRVEGTCEWFTHHKLFRHWLDQPSAALLWVSADPGCGKSVLSRYLVDDVLSGSPGSPCAYFFFNDDFGDQKSGKDALCCILHQLSQNSRACQNLIVQALRGRGDTMLASFRDLWDTLVAAVAVYGGPPVACLLDALDECQEDDRNILIDALTSFYSEVGPSSPNLKFIVTSRPYFAIQSRFHRLENIIPTIHLQGEDEVEVAKIASEIDLVINSRVAEIGMKLGLSAEEQTILREEITRTPNRTYLWACLTLEEVENAIFPCPNSIRAVVRQLPRTVDEAYEKILSRSRDSRLARKLLHMVVAAVMPLTLCQLSVAMAIKSDGIPLEKLSLGPESRFRRVIREICGLFVVVIDSKVYLLHQTAREFLVSPSSTDASATPQGLGWGWKHSLSVLESHAVIAEPCMQALLDMEHSDRRLDGAAGDNPTRKSSYTNEFRNLFKILEPYHDFLRYAAKYWPEHLRYSSFRYQREALSSSLTLFNRTSQSWLFWGGLFDHLVDSIMEWDRISPLYLASYFALDFIVLELLKAGHDPNQRCLDGRVGARTALHVACHLCQEPIVRSLLHFGAEPNVWDSQGLAPIHLLLSGEGDEERITSLLELLLSSKANPNFPARDDRFTPLHYTANLNFVEAARVLISNGADVDAQDCQGQSPLLRAAKSESEDVTRELLKAGADTELKLYETGVAALQYSASRGHEIVVKSLLEANARVRCVDYFGRSPLDEALWQSNFGIADMLVEAGGYSDAELEGIVTALEEKDQAQGGSPGHKEWRQWYTERHKGSGGRGDPKRKAVERRGTDAPSGS